jgi:hypothetical protein
MKTNQATADSGINEVDVDIDIVICSSSANNGADALRSATTTTNDTTEIARTNTNFKKDLVALARTR